MGENRKHGARFFPPKDLVYFSIKTRHNSKAQTFFSKDNFPAERLRFFFWPKLSFSAMIHKIFPVKRLFVLIAICPFKSANL